MSLDTLFLKYEEGLTKNYLVLINEEKLFYELKNIIWIPIDIGDVNGIKIKIKGLGTNIEHYGPWLPCRAN